MFLQNAYRPSRRDAECRHYIFAPYRVLEVPDGVLCLDFGEFLHHDVEIMLQPFDFLRILGGDVRPAQHHEVVNVVAGIEQEPAHCGVGDFLRDKGYRPEVEADKLLDIFHLLVQRHLHGLENLRDHPCPDHLVSVEGPSCLRVISLCGRLAYVMEQGGPSEPEIRLSPDLLLLFVVFKVPVCQLSFGNEGGFKLRQIVHHFEGMGEVLLVPLFIRTFQGQQLRQDEIQQPGFVHQPESYGRPAADEHLVELFRNPFLGEDAHPVPVPADGFQGFGHYPEFMLRSREPGGESDGPDHAQWIVAVGGVRVKRGADDACGKVPYSSERVYQSPEILFLEAECHGIDGEVPSFLVVLDGPVFHNGFPGVFSVGFFPCSHKFHFNAFVAQHCCAEVLENGYIAVYGLAYGFGKTDAAAFHHYVDVLARASQEAVAHIASYHEGPYAFLLRYVRYD